MFAPKMTFETEKAGHDYVDGIVESWPAKWKSKIPKRDAKTVDQRLHIVRIFAGAAEIEARQDSELQRIEDGIGRLDARVAGRAGQADELQDRLQGRSNGAR